MKLSIFKIGLWLISLLVLIRAIPALFGIDFIPTGFLVREVSQMDFLIGSTWGILIIIGIALTVYGFFIERKQKK